MVTANINEAILINNNIAQTLGNLKSRWQDEKEYEDFNEYINVIKQKLLVINPNATFLKLTKAFTLTFKIPSNDYTFEIKTTMRNVVLSYYK